MKKEFIVERQGQTFVRYAGLLDEAHEQGLKSITTTLLQIPNQDNRNTAICQAVVETSKGIFTGIGDAAPDNVSRAMQNCLIRMAETRAKARALRDAINVGVAALEELDGDDNVSDFRPNQNQQPASKPRPVSSGNGNGYAASNGNSHSNNGYSGNGAAQPSNYNNNQNGNNANGDAATEKQLGAIRNLARRLLMDDAELQGHIQKQFGTTLDKLSRSEASALIKNFSQESA